MATSGILTSTTLLAPLLAGGIVLGAQAQAPDTLSRADAAPGWQVGNVVGGGRTATLSGGGDNLTIQYGALGAGSGGMELSQPSPAARFIGTDGDGPRLAYGAVPPAGDGREAWLLGGGDDARVVY